MFSLLRRALVLMLAFYVVFSAPFWAPSLRAADDVCLYCGMKRSQFGHSWVIITYPDGKQDMMCSIHCAAIGMALHTDRAISEITVGDYNSQEQIDATNAFWVIGGDKIGVMTARGKWAFKTQDAALKFIDAHGGEQANFQKVIKAAFEDMYHDTLMIRQKQKLMRLRKNGADKK